MDSGFVVRPASQTSSATGRKSAVRGAVPASLSAPQSVTAVAKPTEVRAEDNSNVRKIVIDAQSREVISEALDAARELTRQPAEDVKQRLRAYVRRTPTRGRSRSALDFEV